MACGAVFESYCWRANENVCPLNEACTDCWKSRRLPIGETFPATNYRTVPKCQFKSTQISFSDEILTVDPCNLPCFVEAGLFSQFNLKRCGIRRQVLVPAPDYGHVHVMGILTDPRYRRHDIGGVVIIVFKVNDQRAGTCGWRIPWKHTQKIYTLVWGKKRQVMPSLLA